MKSGFFVASLLESEEADEAGLEFFNEGFGNHAIVPPPTDDPIHPSREVIKALLNEI